MNFPKGKYADLMSREGKMGECAYRFYISLLVRSLFSLNRCQDLEKTRMVDTIWINNINNHHYLGLGLSV